MRKITNVIAALVVSLTMSSVASASVITTGTLEYDNVSNVITDNVSGETYLGWDMVKDLDYAQTVAITTGTGLYNDWHIASQTEAYSFYNAATGAGVSDVVGDQIHSDDIGVYVDGERFGGSSAPLQDYAWFLSDGLLPAGNLQLYSRYTDLSLTEIFCTLDCTDYNSINGNIAGDSQSSGYNIGWLLVGGSTTVVPEPSIIALFALGLVGIGFARRKRQS